MMFARARDEVVPRLSPTMGPKKVMVTIFFTADRLVALIYFPQGQKYNKEYFINEILEGINQECNHGTGYWVIKTMKININDCRVHNALDTLQAIGRIKIERLAYPSSSAGLSPGNFEFLDGSRQRCKIRDLLMRT
jgi:hypothetical protein